MKEHPILFNGEMVRAILSGQKTQSRRVIKPQPTVDYHSGFVLESMDKTRRYGDVIFTDTVNPVFVTKTEYARYPYGEPGDVLWVRETFSTSGLTRYNYTGDPDEHGGPNDRCCAYAADAMYKCGKPIPPDELAAGSHKWKPSIHMPRWASRITLKVTGVRVERVQDITETDARAEGVSLMHLDDLGQTWATYRRGFEALWDSINAKRGYSWESNPWVWVVTFNPRVAEV